MKVIAVDPGGTTGLAFWDGGFHGEWPQWAAGAPRERRDTWPMVEDLCGWARRFGSDLTFVVEEYRITQRTAQLSQQYTALEVIGAIKFLCHLYSCGIVLQKPGDAKRFASDRRIRAAGLWHQGGAGHANDAARHLYLWLAKNGYVNPLEHDREG